MTLTMRNGKLFAERWSGHFLPAVLITQVRFQYMRELIARL